MNIQVELRKVIDAINSQPPVIRIILWVAVVIFIIVPFAIPATIIYFIWTALKGRERVS